MGQCKYLREFHRGKLSSPLPRQIGTVGNGARKTPSYEYLLAIGLRPWLLFKTIMLYYLEQLIKLIHLFNYQVIKKKIHYKFFYYTNLEIYIY